MFAHKLFKLKNGLKVLTVPILGSPSVTSLILANVGSRYEKPQEQGIAHFLEHMVFKGTKNYPSASALAEAIDAVGAESNAFTSKEYTGFYVKAASVHLPLALDILSDMLFTPKLLPTDIEREKGVILEEMNMYIDMPMRDVGNLFDKLLFTDLSLGHDVIGTKQIILALKKPNFVDFLTHWYYPANLTLVLAGDSQVLGDKKLITKLEKLFDKKLKDKNQVAEQVNTQKLLGRPPLLNEKILVRSQKTQQVHLILGWPALKRSDPRRYALSLLSIILGGNMSSRLFTEVREKRGLCYYVNASPDYFQETGSFAVAAGVDPKRVHEAIRVIIDECENLANLKKPVTKAELKKAQEYAVGSMLLSFEDTQSVAQYFGLRQVLLDQIDSPQEVIEKLRSVKLSEINQLAQELIKRDELRLALIGPFKASEFAKYVKV